ncbi:MAG: YiiX/YebB-like N1pC/P60 family cysteine hydrolase [Gammaproteobacteria bacterium]
MATPVNQKQIQQLPVRKYEAIRNELRTGDLVFCSGSYLFSLIIQAFTHSSWSHVGLIYRDDYLERVFILESEVLIGVRLAPLSKYLQDYHGRRKPYKGRMMIARIQPAIDTEGIKQAISFGLDELTKPYDNWEILRIVIRTLFGIGRKSRDRRYICSELVYECLKKAGLEFKLRGKSISPDLLWCDEKVEAQYRIL